MLLSCTVCSDMMLEAFMNKQGHDNRPKASGQAQAELDRSICAFSTGTTSVSRFHCSL